MFLQLESSTGPFHPQGTSSHTASTALCGYGTVLPSVPSRSLFDAWYFYLVLPGRLGTICYLMQTPGAALSAPCIRLRPSLVFWPIPGAIGNWDNPANNSLLCQQHQVHGILTCCSYRRLWPQGSHTHLTKDRNLRPLPVIRPIIVLLVNALLIRPRTFNPWSPSPSVNT